MFRTRIALISAIAAIGLGSAASAADMPVKAPYAAAPIPYSWSGFYVGAHAGYGWGDTVDDVGAQPFLPAAIASTVNLNPRGGLGGVQVGYNYQVNQMVLGVQSEFAFAGIHGSNSVLAPNGGNFTNADQRIDSFGTVRGRVGFTPNNQWLLYGTGGFAFGHARLTTNIITAGTCGAGICELGSGSKTLTGWTAGAGVEYAFSQKWSVLVEYLYYDLGRISHTATDTTTGTADFKFISANFKGNIVQVGVNYKLGGL
jgi:outer membrane immunogenic protein